MKIFLRAILVLFTTTYMKIYFLPEKVDDFEFEKFRNEKNS